jgi:hypothetical protein
MSTSAERLELLRACSTAADMHTCLYERILELRRSGVEKDLILQDMYTLMFEFRHSGDEAKEDTVMDVMDCLVGWCGTHARID